MSVKKIFMTLIVIVMCVVLGAFLINIFLPNVTTVLINAAEDQIANATGMHLDFNGDGHAGTIGAVTQTGARDGSEDGVTADNTIDGFAK